MKKNMNSKRYFKTALLVLLAAFALSPLSAERGPEYISPNNDGHKDTLEVPLKIKEKRYVKEWSFIITNEKGEVVRTIGNKVSLPDKITFKSFFKSLVTPKKGVDIPSKIVWNGFFDDGTLAPDGVYYYQFTASDDNGNTATSSKLKVIVDNTPPQINLASLSDSEKSFGEGNKVTLNIKQSGSEENLWSAKITDVDGKTIWSKTWENSVPLSVEWDGTDNDGNMIPDGVYNYEITSTDAAENKSEKATINNIVYSAEKPQTSVAISGNRYFSPNGDSKNDTMTFAVNVPKPVSKVNALESWAVKIVGKKDGKVVRTFNGGDPAPAAISFDGNDEEGRALPEGEYYAEVSAHYRNGYEPAVIRSPVFVLDVTAPAAKAIASTKVFNGQNKLKIDQQQIRQEDSWTGEKTWTGKIYNEKNEAVREYDFGTSLPDTVEWDGLSDNGSLVPDGIYTYELSVTEPAGNSSSTKTASFELNTEATELMLSVSPAAFSPNGDGAQDQVTITPVAKASSGIKTYELTVLDEKGKVVHKVSGNGALPKSFTWNGLADDGTRCADGAYSAKIKTEANSGTTAEAASSSFNLDTQAPELEISAPYTVFSPDGTSSRQNIPVTVSKSSVETKWTGEIVSAKGQIVKNFSWQNGTVNDFVWDGTDHNGNKVADGSYTLRISSTDPAGNRNSAVIDKITVDTREAKAYITNAHEVFSPAAEKNNVQKFSVKTSLNEGISAWTFDVVDSASNAVVKHWSQEDSKNLPSDFTWNGLGNDNNPCNGVYVAKLHVDYAKGNSVDAASSMFVCVAGSPQLTVRTTPKYFSPDNDGNDDDLFIQLKSTTLAGLKSWSFTINDKNGNQFWKTSGKSPIAERIIWDGRGNNGDLVQSAEDYPFEFVVTDELGMTNTVKGVIQTDVMVVRDGDKLKMQVPSIIFRGDYADFGVTGTKDAKGKTIARGISEDKLTNNQRVLDMIANALKKFSDYKVTIVGHANPTSNNPDEQTVDNPSNWESLNGNYVGWGPALIPLSQRRAQYVKDELVKRGVNANRLSTDGKGGAEIVVDPTDKINNWKNRRVEFILEK